MCLQARRIGFTDQGAIGCITLAILWVHSYRVGITVPCVVIVLGGLISIVSKALGNVEWKHTT